LVAISRKSFIGATLNITEPEKRLNGTLSATAIAVYKGSHIVRTHDVNQQLMEIIKIAEEIRKNE
jgi:dihydropteroate synthase